MDMLRLPVDVLIASPVEHGVSEFAGKLRFTSRDLHVVALGNEEDTSDDATFLGDLEAQATAMG